MFYVLYTFVKHLLTLPVCDNALAGLAGTAVPTCTTESVLGLAAMGDDVVATAVTGSMSGSGLATVPVDCGVVLPPTLLGAPATQDGDNGATKVLRSGEVCRSNGMRNAYKN